MPILRNIGRRIAALFDPDIEGRARRDAALERRLDELGSVASHLTADVERLSGRLEKLDRSWAGTLKASERAFEGATRRQANVAQRILRTSRNRAERELTRDRVFRRLERISRRRGPVLVGPWTGEVGFELLYWTPFVRWAVRRFRIAPERLVIVSRGGTASWYGPPAAQYRDVFSFRSPEEFRVHTGENPKQRALRQWDRKILREVRASVEGSDISVLHPALMYSLYMPYWKQQEAVSWVTEHADFQRVTPPDVPGLREQLPKEYVALRFYFSKCFPDTPSNRELLAGLVRGLAADTPIVLLGPGIRVDDHHDFSTDPSGRIVSIEKLARPEDNLAVQTAVIGGARAFLGTYGGFSYLAPLCGVNTVAVYSDYNYFAHHLEFARMVFDAVGAAPFTSVGAQALPLLRHLTGSSTVGIERA